MSPWEGGRIARRTGRGWWGETPSPTRVGHLQDGSRCPETGRCADDAAFRADGNCCLCQVYQTVLCQSCKPAPPTNHRHMHTHAPCKVYSCCQKFVHGGYTLPSTFHYDGFCCSTHKQFSYTLNKNDIFTNHECIIIHAGSKL